VPFSRTDRFMLDNTNLWTNGEARFTDVIATDSLITVTQQNTAFINVLNGAFRTTSNNINNTFTIVVSQSANSADGSKAVHIQTFSPHSATNWIEVNADEQYFVHVFDSTTSETLIFDTLPPAAPLASSVAGVTLTSNAMRIFRVGSSATDGNANPQVTSVPLNGNDVQVGDTKFIIWNILFNRPVQLASPTATCCDILTTTPLAFNGGAVTTRRSTSSAPFEVYDASSGAFDCRTLPSSPITNQGLTLTKQFAAPLCEVQGINLAGRFDSTNTSAVCSAGGGPCFQSGSGLFQVSSTSDIDGFFSFPMPVRMCKCDPIEIVCPNVTCLSDELNSIKTGIATSQSALTSAGNTNTADLRTRIATVQSSVNGLSSSTSNDADDILGEVGAVRSDVKKIRKDISSLEDDIKSLEDDIKDLNN